MKRQNAPSTASPARAPRVESIDAVRGIALLGIFVINLPDMAYPEDLALFPAAPGVVSALDHWTLVLSEILFSGKMRGLFAVIFGVSAALYFDRIRQKDSARSAVKLFSRRMFWLGVLGLINAYVFLWWGDILFQYAVLGVILLPILFLGRGPLLGIMLACMALLCIPPALEHRDMLELQTSYEEVQADLDAGRSVEDEDFDIVDDWEDAVDDLRPDPDDVADAVEARDAGYLDAVAGNAPVAFEEQTIYFVQEGIADILLYMTLGVFLVRIGLVGSTGMAGVAPAVVIGTLAAGLGISAIACIQSFDQHLDPVATPLWQVVFELGRLPLVIGYLLTFVMLTSRPGFGRYAFVATGRMALTNYLVQSVIGMLLLYEFGLALFNELSRSDLVGIICLVWVAQIAFSMAWLRFFHVGPFEWLWRSLTIWELRPLVRKRDERN